MSGETSEAGKPKQAMLEGDSCAQCGKVSLWRVNEKASKAFSVHTCTPFAAQPADMLAQRQAQLAWLAEQRRLGKVI